MLILLWVLSQVAPFDVPADYGQLARQHCANEWPDDFQMQAYCLKQQFEGMLQFKQVSDQLGKSIERALENCVEEWTKNRVPDFQMIGYCAKQQAEGYRKINERG